MSLIKWRCPNCWTDYEIDEKFAPALEKKKDCKYCVRKDPKIPTTAEMDGQETIEDMRGRFDMTFQCLHDSKWKVHMNFGREGNRKYLPCDTCGNTAYDTGGGKSLRSFDPVKDPKKKVSAKLKKSLLK